jgi:hypothetical protein
MSPVPGFSLISKGEKASVPISILHATALCCPSEQRNGKLCEPEKQYKSSFCHDADSDQVIEKFILL